MNRIRPTSKLRASEFRREPWMPEGYPPARRWAVVAGRITQEEGQENVS